MYIKQKMYSKKQAYMNVETGKSRLCTMVQQAGDPIELMFQFESEGHLMQNQKGPTWQVKSAGNLLENSLLLAGVWAFFLSKPLTDW